MWRDHVQKRRAIIREHADRADRSHPYRLDEPSDRGQNFLKWSIACQLLENLPLCCRNPLGSLSLGDVGDTAAHESAIATRHAHESDFADEILAEGVSMHPLVDLGLTVQCSLNVFAGLFR